MDGMILRRTKIDSQTMHMAPRIVEARRQRKRVRDEKLNRIVGIAIEIFAREGLAGFSMRRIAAAAHVNLSTLQHYFGNKENLLINTVDSLLKSYVENYVDIAGEETLKPEEALWEIVDDLLALTKNQTVVGFYMNLWALASQDEAMRTRVRESYTPYYECMIGIVWRIRPDLSADLAAGLGMAICAQIDGVFLMKIVGSYDEPAWERCIAQSRDVCANMLANCYRD